MSQESQPNFFLEATNPKLDEVAKQLNDNSISAKLEGMKRLIAMISKGRNVASLFPQVVKNVICPDVEVKKLVYMYLIHYAEFEQDLALLSINTFQKGLDDPNPYIRSQAMKVLSGTRLKVIVQIIILGIKKCITDNSPYVRKTAAHAIPKVYSLDHGIKEDLIEGIEILLGDNANLVLGSAVAAFCEVCPERIDLIHPHFRKLCNTLIDIDEWGQITILNMMARYVRNQFGNPNPNSSHPKAKKSKKKSKFYSDSESDSESSEEEEIPGELDSDHRLILRAATPLLQSRNTGVVLAAAMVIFYCGPKEEVSKIGKSLVRISRSPPGSQYIVLSNISTISLTHPEVFAPYLNEFFVYDTDPVYIQQLKLEILSRIASESTISRVLKEFDHYVRKEDKTFVTAAIQAIGRCATRLPEVQESCLTGLLTLLTNKSEVVVAESVVVIKNLLQLGAGSDKIISQLAKLLNVINVPKARASIIWVVGEYSTKIPLLAPDIFRTLALSFPHEDSTVKLQILSMGAKLTLIPETVHPSVILIFQYVCNLAKYDTNYDIRDRCRMFRGVLFNSNNNELRRNAKRLFCSSKPAPEDEIFDDNERFILNSLSHIVKHTAVGYRKLEDWPLEVPDPSVRNQIPRKQRTQMVGFSSTSFPNYAVAQKNTTATYDDKFYSDEEYSHSDDSYDSEYDSEDSADYDKSKPSAAKSTQSPSTSSSKPKSKKKSSSFYSDESDYTDDDYSDEDDSETDSFAPPAKSSSSSKPKSSSSASSSSSSWGAAPSTTSSSSSSADPYASWGAPPKVTSSGSGTNLKGSNEGFDSWTPQKNDNVGGDAGWGASPVVANKQPSKNLLDDFFSSPSPSPLMSSQPSSSNNALNDILSFDSMPSMSPSSVSAVQPSSSSSAANIKRKKQIILKPVVSNGICVEYLFLRRGSIHGDSFSVIQLTITNGSRSPLENIRIVTKPTQSQDDGDEYEEVVIGFSDINILPTSATVDVLINVKFASFTRPIKFDLVHTAGSYPLELIPPVGELIKDANISLSTFADQQRKMSGLQEASSYLNVSNFDSVEGQILSTTNVQCIEKSKTSLKFAGTTIIDNEPLLVSLEANDDTVKCVVNCGNAVFANTLLKALKASLN